MKVKLFLVMIICGAFLMPPQAEGQILKKLKKKLERKEGKKSKKDNSTEEVTEAEEVITFLDLMTISFDHPQLLDFDIPTYRGKRIKYSIRNKPADLSKELSLNLNKVQAFARLLDYDKDHNYHRMALKLLLREEAYQSYFQNPEFKSSSRKGFANTWGGEKANEFVVRRAKKAYEESKIVETASSVLDQFPKFYYEVSEYSFSNYDFESERYLIPIGNNRSYPLTLTPSEAEAYASKKIYILKIGDSKNPVGWELYEDIYLKTLFKKVEKGDLLESIQTRNGYITVPIIEPVLEGEEFDRIIELFMSNCESKKGLGAYDCECLKPKFIDYVKVNMKSPNQLLARWNNNSYLENACRDGKKMMFMPSRPRGVTIESGVYKISDSATGIVRNACDVLSDLKQGKGALLFGEGQFNDLSGFFIGMEDDPACRNRDELYKYAKSDGMRRFDQYLSHGGSKSKEEFATCFADNFVDLATKFKARLTGRVVTNLGTSAYARCRQ